MQQVLQTVISPLLIYRLAFGVGAVFIYAEGFLADGRVDLPEDGLEDLHDALSRALETLAYRSAGATRIPDAKPYNPQPRI